MKKKILAITLCVAMLAIMLVSGTLAYFTDKDADVNVMTSGNVTIVQNETNRNGDAWAVNNKAHLVPAVYPGGTLVDPTENFVGPNGGNMKMHTDATVKNVVDKVISVTNTGSEAAYIRTIVLVENNDGLGAKLHYLRNGDGVDFWAAKGDITVDGVVGKYSIWCFTYLAPVASGATTAPSLKQIWLDPTTENDWYEKLGDDNELTIIAFSQAAQAQGFDTADEALTAAFGDAYSETNISNWLAGITTIKTDGAANVVGGELPAA